MSLWPHGPNLFKKTRFEATSSRFTVDLDPRVESPSRFQASWTLAEAAFRKDAQVTRVPFRPQAGFHWMLCCCAIEVVRARGRIQPGVWVCRGFRNLRVDFARPQQLPLATPWPRLWEDSRRRRKETRWPLFPSTMTRPFERPFCCVGEFPAARPSPPPPF